MRVTPALGEVQSMLVRGSRVMMRSFTFMGSDSYRVRALAESLFDHEVRRLAFGRRGTVPGPFECARRAREIEAGNPSAGGNGARAPFVRWAASP